MSVFNQKEKYWHGPEIAKNPIFNPNNGVADILFDALSSHPDQIAQINADNDNRIAFHEILEKSINVAENLKSAGYRQGDVFSIISRNNEDSAPVVFGTIFLGAVLNTLDVSLDESDLCHIFDNLRPKLIFVDLICLMKVKAVLTELKITSKIIIFDESQSQIPNVRSLFHQPDISSSPIFKIEPILNPQTRIAFILCTSGITGPNKFVCLSHAQIISEVLRLWNWSVTASDVTFSFSSLFWVSGLANLLIATVKGASRIITQRNYSSDLLFELMEKYKLTQICLANACIADFISNKKIENVDFGSLKHVIIGGSIVCDEIKAEFRKKLEKFKTKVVEVYGFIEIGSLVTSTRHGSKKGSCGIVATQNLVKIINEKGKNLGPGEVGEICAKNTCRFLGYFNDEDLTKQAVDSNGWIKSGDLGFFDEDGFLFIKGKIKELIKLKGITISPETIESTIQQNLKIAQVCAVRINEPRQPEDMPALVIKLPENYPLTKEEVVEKVHELLPDELSLKGGVYFVETFPMTPSGKVKRGALKELAENSYREQLKKVEKERRKQEPAPMYFLS
ncbi:probable 4-coumarate--CoA ligase 1 [Culicoides brevitarsis]|uniref:probable 4-coumarate--CoA ligase 1 n=1 Tax=Culicoides brevitarsis TaxID=469753 RepID=UPI00307BE337